jgi:GMP synthase-like glutamine amidotransferase
MRALVIGNADDGVGLLSGFVGERLRAHGAQLVDAPRERPGTWPELESVDAVVALGSRWNVGRPETAQLVETEAALLRMAHERGTPVLGICFGGQVLAHALGGTVARAATPEIGWVPITLTTAADRFDLPAGVTGPWMQWHQDIFSVPEGFTELARSPAGPQLMVAGRSLGTQFHPEVTMAMLEAWAAGGARQLRAVGGDPDALLAESATRLIHSEGAAHALVDWFLELG